MKRFAVVPFTMAAAIAVIGPRTPVSAQPSPTTPVQPTATASAPATATTSPQPTVTTSAQPTPTTTPAAACKGQARILANIRGVNVRTIDEKSCVQQKNCADEKHCKVLSEDPDGGGPLPVTSWCGCPGEKAPPKECTTLIVPDPNPKRPDHVRCEGTCPGAQKCCPRWVGAEGTGKGADRGFCECSCADLSAGKCPASGAPVADACD